jgi:hypothetical protein
VQVWLAASCESHKGQFFGRAIGSYFPIPAKRSVEFFVFTYVLGHVALQLTSVRSLKRSPAAGAQLEESQEMARMTSEIWPPSPVGTVWPPTEPIGPPELVEAFHDRWRTLRLPESTVREIEKRKSKRRT